MYESIWLNITYNNDYNRCHNHKDQADLVFVLYLTKGTLWLRNPNHRPKLDRFYSHMGSSLSIEFNTGDMILFPSNYMYPHTINRITSGTRYVIATWFR